MCLKSPNQHGNSIVASQGLKGVGDDAVLTKALGQKTTFTMLGKAERRSIAEKVATKEELSRSLREYAEDPGLLARTGTLPLP